MIAMEPFEMNGVLYSPEMNTTVIEFSMNDMNTGQYLGIKMLLDDLITYLEDASDQFWGVHTPVRIRRVMEGLTHIEYKQLMHQFVRLHLPMPKESSDSRAVAAGVFDLFDPTCN